jgi:glycosyltransferase involved in cell wall biosynthesis
VDLFLLYFRNIDGYVNQFGIPRERTLYVPFKANNWERLNQLAGEPGAGEYILLAGATLRDHATFVEAARISGLPSVLLIPGGDRAAVERSSWYTSGLPDNLRLEYHVDGKEETYIAYFEKSCIFCVPRFRWDVASTGISGYLCAMALAKCVLISRGPGADDILSENRSAAFFTPEDAADLARVMTDLWSNDSRRQHIARNGQEYANRLQGETRLLRDIIRAVGIASD